MKPAQLCFLVVTMATSLFAADPAFDTWADALATDTVRADPIEATYSQYFSGAEQDALDRQLTPITREYRAARIAAARKALAEFAKFDRSKLDERQRTSAGVIEWSLNVTVNSEPFADFRFIFNQFGGLHVSLVRFLSQTHPIRNRRDIENYLARLELVAGQLEEGMHQAKDAAARGFVLRDEPRPSLRLQNRHAENPRTPRQGAKGARRKIHAQGIPQLGPANRQHPTCRARAVNRRPHLRDG
jgi:uncharacterized protein (DUF885 family)